MTNAEKYKSATERRAAYKRYEKERHRVVLCEFAWLEAPAKKTELNPCPMCGNSHIKIDLHTFNGYYAECVCGLSTGYYHTEEELVAKWNRSAR